MLNELSTWIMSIAGIICLSVIVELMLPDGQMNRYIKGTFSFIIILVIIMPIPKLLGTELKFPNIFDYDNIQVDEDYIYQLNLDKINKVKEEVEEEIENHGYRNVVIYINCDIFDNAMQYKSITVDLTNLVISENAEHKNILKIKKDITSIITDHIKIDEEDVLYDEWFQIEI